MPHTLVAWEELQGSGTTDRELLLQNAAGADSVLKGGRTVSVLAPLGYSRLSSRPPQLGEHHDRTHQVSGFPSA